MSISTHNVRIVSCDELVTPNMLMNEMPLSGASQTSIQNFRDDITNIVHGYDSRQLVIVGPCSIHDPNAAIEYAKKLKCIADKVNEHIFIVMRVYFEKPRTTVGWKGLINDPDMTGEFNINKGLRMARKLLIDINNIGLPIGCEFLDSISPQYISDLVSWGAIGARTVESQIHRELASGLSCPIGIKNGTNGDVEVAIDAILTAREKHHFLGVTEYGKAAVVETCGNRDTHLILRGARTHTNYSAVHVAEVRTMLLEKSLLKNTRILIDISHGNSQKQYHKQFDVMKNVIEQIQKQRLELVPSIMGVMIESNLNEGNQPLVIGENDPGKLKYGVSVTDGCVDFETTVQMIDLLHNSLIFKYSNYLK